MDVNVIIVGGGPAGIITALTAKSVYPEKSVCVIKEIGDGVIPCAIPYMMRTLEDASQNAMGNAPLEKAGVEIIVGKVVSLDTDAHTVNLESGKILSYERLVIATGADPVLPPIPGIEADRVVQARALYEGEWPAGDRIVIVGGGDIGCETADWLAASGKQVSIVETAPQVLARMKDIPKARLLARLAEKNVQIYTETQVVSIEARKVRLKKKDGSEFRLQADLVVLGINAQSEDVLFHKLQDKVKEVIAVGDAASPGNLGAALRNATEAALKI